MEFEFGGLLFLVLIIYGPLVIVALLLFYLNMMFGYAIHNKLLPKDAKKVIPETLFAILLSTAFVIIEMVFIINAFDPIGRWT